jgi:hypothetical protein
MIQNHIYFFEYLLLNEEPAANGVEGGSFVCLTQILRIS